MVSPPFFILICLNIITQNKKMSRKMTLFEDILIKRIEAIKVIEI